MASNVSPLVNEIRQLKELEKAIGLVSVNSKHPRNVNIILKKEIVDRVASLCHDFLKAFEGTPFYDEVQIEGTYADLYGMLQQVLEEIRK